MSMCRSALLCPDKTNVYALLFCPVYLGFIQTTCVWKFMIISVLEFIVSIATIIGAIDILKKYAFNMAESESDEEDKNTSTDDDKKKL